MTKQVINIGTAANAKNGDVLRTAFEKVNANFTELYAGAAAEDRLTNGAHQLTLNVNGTTPYVTFPAVSGGSIIIQGSEISGSGSGAASIATLSSAESDVRLSANAAGTRKNWTFGTNGSLTFPDATVQTKAYTGIPGPYANDAAAAAANVAVGYPYHKTGTSGQVFVRLA
jgi:hypothetical protein